MRFTNPIAIFSSIILALFLLIPATASETQQQPGAGVTVKMARPTWETGWFHAYVYKQLLEELGYELPRLVTVENRAFYKSVSRGELDLWVNSWFPTHNVYEDDFKDGARRIGYVAKNGAIQGYLVSREHAEKYDIETLSDFKRPEVREAFDRNGDGRAEMVGCPPGWVCEEVIAHHWETYGLDEHVELIKADFYSSAMTEELARYRNGKSIFFYTWSPNWTVGVLKPGQDVVWITVEATSLPEKLARLRDETVVQSLDGCVKDPCNLGWPTNDIRPVANNEFLEGNPAAATLLREARIPLDDIAEQNALMHRGENTPEDLKRHASEWIRNNRDLVEEWLHKARQAAM